MCEPDLIAGPRTPVRDRPPEPCGRRRLPVHAPTGADGERARPGPAVGRLLLSALVSTAIATALVAALSVVLQEWTPGARGAAQVLLAAQVEASFPDRDRAVRLAREGAYEEALAILRPLYAAQPDDLGLRADLVAVLSWAGQDEEALELGERLPFAEIEPFVAEAVARSARNLGRPVLAWGLYSSVLERDSTRIESWVGVSMATLERGLPDEALERVEAGLERSPGHSELLLARGHILRALGRPLEAALSVREAAAAGASSAEALRIEVLSLLDGGAPFLAAERMLDDPDRFDAGERARLLAERGSRAVQWTVAAPERPDPALRFEAVDRAILRLDSALAVVEPTVGWPFDQLRFDRVVALRERVRMAEVAAEVEELEGEGVALPPYVHRVAGDAYLYLRHPARAERHYRAAIEGWPAHPESRIGLFYALLEQERHRDAQEVAAALLEMQPERRTAEGLREELPNPDRLQAKIALNLGRAFGGDLRGAEEAFRELNLRAPLNLDIRQELASVQRWRGWPRAAIADYDRMLALDPHHVGARVGRGAALLEVGDRRAARATYDTLVVLAPEHQHVIRATERFRVLGLWHLSIEARGGRSTGGEFGTRDDGLAVRLTTPWIGDRARLFAGSWRSSASYPDGRGIQDRIEVGGSLHRAGLDLELGVGADREGAGDPAGRGSLAWSPGDHWSFRVQGASWAREVPLQAARAGIDGWTAGTGFGRRASDRRWWSADGAFLRMSDGNRRWSLWSALEQEVARTPRNRLSAVGELYGAQNSLEDAPYFNPARTASGTLALRWDLLAWRAWEKEMRQRIQVAGGRLHQEDFNDRWLYSAEIEHEWNLTERFNLEYGVHWGRPVYDADRERRWGGHAALRWRLPR